MKNHFYISYFGNKRDEVENIYTHLNLEGIETIIEPFCGSGAISFYISQQEPKKYKYVLNDNNKYLLEMFNTIKDENKLKKFEKLLSRTIDTIQDNKGKYNDIVSQDNLLGWFIKNKYYNIRPGLFPEGKKMKYKPFSDYPIFNFFNSENIVFTKKDAIEIYEKYKDDPKNLIILDPPYMQTCNDFYLDKTVNIYEYLYNHNIQDENAKIYLILENMWIIKLLFSRNNILDTYDKTYQTTKKKTSHILIYNKKG